MNQSVQNTVLKKITPEKIKELSERLDILEDKNIKKDDKDDGNINLRERMMKRHV